MIDITSDILERERKKEFITRSFLWPGHNEVPNGLFSCAAGSHTDFEASGVFTIFNGEEGIALTMPIFRSFGITAIAAGPPHFLRMR